MSRLKGKVALVITVLLPELGPLELLGVSAHRPVVVEANGMRAAPHEGALIGQQENTTPADALAELLLSGRECDILRLIAQGCVTKEIARMLSIAPETVKSHVKNIFVKLNVQKRAQAVSRAQGLGLIGTA